MSYNGKEQCNVLQLLGRNFNFVVRCVFSFWLVAVAFLKRVELKLSLIRERISRLQFSCYKLAENRKLTHHEFYN